MTGHIRRRITQSLSNMLAVTLEPVAQLQSEIEPDYVNQGGVLADAGDTAPPVTEAEDPQPEDKS